MMTSKLEWALYWASLGLYVFPVHPDSKTPALQGWPDLATLDFAQIERWWAACPDYNIGCVPGRSGHAAIDIDTKNGAPGRASLAACIADLGDLPRTLQTRTPTGGEHFWLAMEGAGNSASKLGPGLDVRGVGGYVLMPGSTLGGVPYAVQVDADIAPAPEAWATAIKAPRARREATGAVEIDSERAIARAAAEIADAIEAGDVAVEGAGGNDRTYRLFTRLRDLGVSQERALEVAAPWNEACAPPWDADEFARVAEHAYQYAQNAPGAYANEQTLDEALATLTGDLLTPEPRRGRANRFTLRNPRQSAERPAPEWLVPGYLPLGEVTMLYGPRASFKSFAALDAAMATAAGLCIWGLDYEARQGPAVYITNESTHDLEANRVPAWLEDRKRDLDLPFYVMDDMPQVAGGHAEYDAAMKAIRARLKADGHARPLLIVIDTHARAMTGLDENTAQDAGRAIALYDRLAQELQCAVIVVHHTEKSGEVERGSTAFGNACAVIYSFKRHGEKLSLECKRMKMSKEPAPIHFDAVDVAGSKVLAKSETPAAAPLAAKVGSEIAQIALRILKDENRDDPGRAIKTRALAEMFPEVVRQTIDVERITARELIEEALERLAKKELRAAYDVERKAWFLPPDQSD